MRAVSEKVRCEIAVETEDTKAGWVTTLPQPRVQVSCLRIRGALGGTCSVNVVQRKAFQKRFSAADTRGTPIRSKRRLLEILIVSLHTHYNNAVSYAYLRQIGVSTIRKRYERQQ